MPMIAPARPHRPSRFWFSADFEGATISRMPQLHRPRTLCPGQLLMLLATLPKERQRMHILRSFVTILANTADRALMQGGPMRGRRSADAGYVGRPLGRVR